MKLLLFLVLLSLIAFNKTEDQCSNLYIPASGPKDCENRYKAFGDSSYCCYIEGDYINIKNVKSCLNIPEESYKDIDKFIEESNKNHNIKKLDCKSFYLHLSFINLILFLF